MKQFIKVISALSVLCSLAFSQAEKPGAAVYIMGNPEGRDALRQAAYTSLVKSGKYQMIAVDAVDVIAEEQVRQMSGGVPDDQIARLGQDAGAKYVCVVERTESDGVAFVTVRIVGVESKVAELAEMAPIPKGEMITSVLEKLVSKMLMLPGAVIRDDKAGIELVIVKGGEFTMGCTAEQGRECLDNEKPARKATLGDFYIGKYEVTQKQWVEVMGSNPSHFKGDDLPVESVSWMEVQEFISKLRQITGRRYRLPTEAEWEYAARGGQSTKNFMYSGGNHADETAWYIGNSGEKTHAVGTKDPNELGIYDMSGNVWEWVADWYGKYSAAAQENPSGPSAGANRVFRGGGWSGEAWYCRVSGRFNYTPIIRYHSLGFRLALTP